uniref:Uncharacterized protein n=1 Tax=Populus trichocarpa TaxID=3694 RepID=A0A3N7FJM4_POPTR
MGAVVEWLFSCLKGTSVNSVPCKFCEGTV